MVEGTFKTGTGDFYSWSRPHKGSAGFLRGTYGSMERVDTVRSLVLSISAAARSRSLSTTSSLSLSLLSRLAASRSRSSSPGKKMP